MEQLRSAMEEHMEQMADLVQKLSAELRSGLKPALDNFLGFFHAINWKHRPSGFSGYYTTDPEQIFMSRFCCQYRTS
ncbi:hypothetical protein GBA52_026122 [Prunus armeniaca]|nr:hypothetical protein GBA52_026122 [Prunus armeniaca]